MKHDVYDAPSGTTAPARRPGLDDRPGAPSGADKQELMRKAEVAGRPGPQHKHLDHYIGQWRCDVKCFMDPNGQPEQSQGSAKIEWIMDGRFIREKFEGQFMGKPFHGRSILGFNNVKQVYQSTWIDDMNTAMFTSEGRGDEKNITLEGLSSCPATGRADVPMKVVLRILGPDKHTFEMFDGSRGNMRTMEITYTRQ